MNEDQKLFKKSQKIEHFEDEIELIDVLRVIWKWKYIIIVGTAVCGMIALIISLKMTKVYSISMTLKPGILKIGEQGKNVYIDSPQNIKDLIDSGAFNNQILNYLKENKLDNIPNKLDFKLTIPKNSDNINVKYETADIKKGVIIQDHLSKLLINEYDKKVKHFREEYDITSSLLKHEIDLIIANIQSYKRQIRNIEKRNSELILEIKLIKNNTSNLVSEKNKLLSTNLREKDIPQVLFHTYLIQENLKLSNSYLNEINDYMFKKEEQLKNIRDLEYKKENIIYDLKKIQYERDNIQNIQILEPPNSNHYPIKPKTKLNIIFALLAGLFLMMFLAFLLEYLSKHNKNKNL